jgi:16S rRNA (cytosine967-C5)-methyltransferase
MATLKTQAEILGSYPSMLKKGGILVYATCSVFPSENHESVKSFISTHLNYHLEKELELLPTNNDFDGFYAARLTNVSK